MKGRYLGGGAARKTGKQSGRNMEEQRIEAVIDRLEEYVDQWTPGRLARRYCEWLTPASDPVVIRKHLPKGYLIARLLRWEFGISDNVTELA